jgi:hypothetical protein
MYSIILEITAYEGESMQKRGVTEHWKLVDAESEESVLKQHVLASHPPCAGNLREICIDIVTLFCCSH